MIENGITKIIEGTMKFKPNILASSAHMKNASSWNTANPLAKLISEYITQPLPNKIITLADIVMVIDELNKYFTTISSLRVVKCGLIKSNLINNSSIKSGKVNPRNVAGADLFSIHGALCLIYRHGHVMRIMPMIIHAIRSCSIDTISKLLRGNIDACRFKIVTLCSIGGGKQFVHNYVNKCLRGRSSVCKNTDIVEIVRTTSECILRGPRPEDVELYALFETSGWNPEARLREFKKCIVREVLFLSNNINYRNNLILGALMGECADDDELNTYLLHLLDSGANGDNIAYKKLCLCVQHARSAGKIIPETTSVKIIDATERRKKAMCQYTACTISR